MTREGIIFMIVITAIVLGGCLLAYIIGINAKHSEVKPQNDEPSKPRIILPTDCDIFSFTISSQLKPEEWQMILNAGWTFLTCNTYQTTEYAGCYPEAPCYNCTKWNYVFRRAGNNIINKED